MCSDPSMSERPSGNFYTSQKSKKIFTFLSKRKLPNKDLIK